MTRYSGIARSIRRVLAVGAVTVASGVVAVHAQEQNQASSEQTLQTVVVTGSMIKRSDFETPSPVQVMTADDLQQSGYTSVSDVLRNLSANGQGTLSQAFPGAFAGGGSGVALRGLTVGATLTLIDGERMVAYPLSDDGERSFVDVSSIPMLAVDRVDVLKDGASAEYGSDAMAGVVNVILKKNYSGAEFSAEGGSTQHGDGTTERLTGIFGRGDLASDGYNAYVAVEYRHQDEIFVGARSGAWTTLNWAPYGGTNGIPGAGSNYAKLGLGPADPPASGAYLVPNSGTAFNGAGVIYPGTTCPSAAALAADQCTFTENREEIQPQTSNLNVLGRFTKNLGGDWQAVVTGSMFRSLAEQVGAYPSISPSGPGNPFQEPSYGPGFSTVTAPVTITVPCGNPMNPSGPTCAPMYPVGNLFEAGAFNDQFVTNTYRLFADFRGTALGWDMDADAGYMYANTGQTYHGLVNYSALNTALDNGYVFGTGGPDVADFSPPVISHMSNSLEVVDLRGTRDVTTLPGGPLSLGLGVGYNHRYLDSTQSPMAETGDYQVINNAYAYGGQTDASAYAELVAPIVKGLEVDGAVRYDHYNNADATVPKFGVKYTPFSMITFRGTWGKGFRAPNPAEYANAASAFLQGSFADTLLCPSSAAGAIFPQFNLATTKTPVKGDVAAFCNFTPVFENTTNPNLVPEKSTNYTYGLIFSPWETVSLSVDYWDVKINNLILTPSEFPALPFAPSPIVNARTGPVTLPVTGGGTATFAAGQPIYSSLAYENAGNIHVNGIDFDLSSHWNLGPGRLNASLNWTHEIDWVASSCYAGTCGSVELAGTHGPSGISGDTGNPRDRGVLTIGWDQGPWNITGTVNYIGSFTVEDPSLGAAGDTCAAGIVGSFNGGTKFLNGFYPAQYCTVKSFTDLDLYSQYAFTKSFTLYGSILNAFNQQPPVDLNSYGQGGGLDYNPAMHQAGAVGRFFNMGVKFTF